MNPGVTYLYLVIDASGSMNHAKRAIINGVNTMLEEQKKNGHDELHVGFIVFHGLPQEYPARPIEELPAFGGLGLPYCPAGGTALNRAVSIAIGLARRDIQSRPPHQQPGRVLFFVQTDGETADGDWWGNEASEKILAAMQQGWEFCYIQEGKHVTQGKHMGFMRGFNYPANKDSEMIEAVSRMSVAFRTGDVPNGWWSLEQVLDGSFLRSRMR
jgi:uncharacterized protein YegL